jgi:hypothetical protein
MSERKCTYTLSSAPAGSFTFDDLAKLADSLPPPPPPPKPDPSQCFVCKEPMSEPAMRWVSSPSMFATTVGYLCGRCAYMAKQAWREQERA